MKHGLAIFLGHDFLGLADSQHVVIEFPTREAAIEFAAKAIRKGDPDFIYDFKEPPTDEELVSEYGHAVGLSEYFHVYPIHSPEFLDVG